MLKDDTFFKKVITKKVIIDDEEIELPIKYYKDWAMIGIFIASTKQIIKILPTKRFMPIEIFPSKAIVSLVGLRHFDTSIGPFNELDIGIPVLFDTKFTIPFFSALLYHKNINFGVYMFKLFVSDRKALTAGIKVWHYPKVISEISFDETEFHHVMNISENRKLILKLMTKKETTAVAKKHETTFNIYSIKDNMILKSPVNWKGARYLSRFSNHASFELGDSLYSSEISDLAIENYCVEASLYPDLQYILNAPIASYSLHKD